MSFIKFTWVVPAVAVAMLALTALPAEIWKAPADDQVFRGFDSSLVYVSAAGAAVRLSRDSIDISSQSSSEPNVNLATTLMPKLSASVDVTVLDNSNATEPFRIGLWSPWTNTGQFVLFGPSPDNRVTADTVDTNHGAVTTSTELGHYRVGAPYHVAVLLDRPDRTITTRVSGEGIDTPQTSISSGLFGNVQISLAASASPGPGATHVVLRNFILTLPHQRLWASKVADVRATALLILLALIGTVLLVIAVIRGWPRNTRVRSVNASRRVSLWVPTAIGVYLVGNALLFPLGGHPFDMANEKFYAYVASAYGPAQLYYLPNVVSLAWIWDGIPFIESAFPYEPVSAYLHTAIGWLGSLLFGSFGPRSVQVEYLTKAVNVAFGLADAVLIYAILRQIGSPTRWSFVAGALFLFNPAVWFSMSVWGQTHVFSLCLVLLTVLFIERKQPMWAWLALAAACLTRPQMLVFGLLLGIVLLRKFPWRQSVAAVSWTVIPVFILLLPFTLATSPSLPIDILVHNLNVQEASGNVATLTTVSQDSYSIWPLITYLVRGASSLQRAFTPSSEILVGSLSYQRVSQLLTVGAILVVAGALLLKKRLIDEPGAYLPFIALGIGSFLMLLTGILATHFLLALPFLILCRRWMSGTAYFYVVVVWTITTLVPMYGDMGVAMSPQDYPLLARANNPITQFVVNIYSWDRFITVGVVANICALVWLGFQSWRPIVAASTAQPALQQSSN